MQELPNVLYCSQDVDAVLDRWNQAERPFVLEGISPASETESLFARDDVDCFVVHGGQALVDAVLETAEYMNQSAALVVFATGHDTAGTTALERGVTHYVSVGEDFDPVAALASLESVAKEHRRTRRERTMIDSLLEHVPLSIYFKDRQSRHVRVSDMLTELAEPDPSFIRNDEGKRHHTPEDVLGKTDFDLYNPDHAAEAIEDDRQVMTSEEPIRNRVEGPFGERRDQTYISTSKAPWYDENGDVVGIVGVTQDVSERKQYEHRLERQNERLERFAGVISHDLRNPLSVALGRIDVARETGDPEQFDIIEHSLERMEALIDDLLTLASDGKTVDDPSPVTLEPLANDAWEVIDSGTADLQVTADTQLLADPGRLRQLFENLFRNATEHCTDGVTITVGDLADESGFFVADDGHGIPPEQRDQVFESGHTTSDQGTGLGLSIVRSIAEAHGWSVDVVESADGGARFEFAGVAQPRSCPT